MIVYHLYIFFSLHYRIKREKVFPFFDIVYNILSNISYVCMRYLGYGTPLYLDPTELY